MYLSHWNLSHSPFHPAAGLGPAYPSEAFEEATARIDYLVQERRRVGALLGEAGLGKSTVVQGVGPMLARRGAKVATVDAVGLSPTELLWQVTSQLGAQPDRADDAPRLWRRLEDQLTHNRWQNAETVLLVDDADQAGADLQRQLIRLAGLESAPGARWTIILASDPQRLGGLSTSLLHRIDLRVDLFEWTLSDTTGYVQHALIDAGSHRPIFTDEALLRLQEKSTGIPRYVVRLADFALVVGASAGLDHVGPQEIDAAFSELRWSPPAATHLV
ncbi:MAG: AAA family ATPase [Planctomycetota bacterium]